MTRRVLYLPLLALLLWPASALAATTSDTTPDEIWALVAGALVPLVTYAVNKTAPWTSETVKAIVLFVASAVTGGITQAITAGNVGLNKETLGYVVAALVGSLGAHHTAWKPSGISWRLGGGQNRQGQLANPAPVPPKS